MQSLAAGLRLPCLSWACSWAYFKLRSLDQQLAISQATLKSYQASRPLVVLRRQRGMVFKQDVAQVDALVHTAGAKIPDLERQMAQKENEICILLGQNPQPIPRSQPLPDLTVRAQVPPGLAAALLERRPDIRQAEEVLIAANYRIGAARANFFPRITLTALGGTQSIDLALSQFTVRQAFREVSDGLVAHAKFREFPGSKAAGAPGRHDRGQQ